MKKTISILMILLLVAVVCASFVACDEVNPTGGGDIPPACEDIQPFDFAKESEFSFGGFTEDKIIGLGNRALYGRRYNEATTAAVSPEYEDKKALLMDNDTVASVTISKMQALFEKYATNDNTNFGLIFSEAQKYNPTEQNLLDYVERTQGALTSWTYGWANNGANLLENTPVGGVFHDRWLVLAKENKGDMVVAYTMRIVLSDYSSFNGNHDTAFMHINVEFGMLMGKKDVGAMTQSFITLELILYPEQFADEELNTLFAGTEFEGYADLYARDYAKVIYNALKKATAEEKLDMAEGYFAVMEEVIDAWMADPRGQAHVNNVYG